MLRAHRLLAASMRSIKGAPGPLRATSRGMADDSDQAMVRPEDIDTRKLYRDCLRLSYHIAAEVRRSCNAVARRSGKHTALHGQTR
jgi:hypothetical protein